MPMKFEKHKSFKEAPTAIIQDEDGNFKPKLTPPKHPRPPSWKVKRTFKELGAVSSLAVCPSGLAGDRRGRYLAVGRDDEHIAIWDLEKKQRIAK
jgi:hypothetical protein